VCLQFPAACAALLNRVVLTYDNLPGLHVSVEAGIATVTLNHPPLNLMDGVLLPSLRGFLHRVHRDAAVKVIVFQSADPQFFSAHGDMAYLTDPEALPAATDAAIAAAPGWDVPEGLNILQTMSEEVRNLPQVTIGKLEGFARGAGNEFFMYLDMRFAAIGKSGQAQPEAQMGILPGGGGTVNMTRLIGRARTLELLLGAELVARKPSLQSKRPSTPWHPQCRWRPTPSKTPLYTRHSATKFSNWPTNSSPPESKPAKVNWTTSASPIASRLRPEASTIE